LGLNFHRGLLALAGRNLVIQIISIADNPEIPNAFPQSDRGLTAAIWVAIDLVKTRGDSRFDRF
jgi:hypothetical protein